MRVDTGVRDREVGAFAGGGCWDKVISRGVEEAFFNFKKVGQSNFCSPLLQGRPTQGSHVCLRSSMDAGAVSGNEAGGTFVDEF